MTATIPVNSGSSVTIEVAADLNKDGDFSDSGEDITAFVKSAEWQLGFADQFEAIARDTTVRLILDNSDKRFSPEVVSGVSVFSTSTPGKVVRIRTTHGPKTRVMALGWMLAMKPTAGKWGPRVADVDTEGFLGRAQNAEVFIPAQQNVTADQVITTILSNALLYPPGFTGRWLLGEIGFGELGENTVLGAVTDYFSGDVGKTTFVFAGDNWHDGTSVLGALRDTAGREAGRVYVDRDGVIRFWNRHRLITTTTVSASFNDTMAGIEYEYGSDIVNRVTVRARPRKLSASGQTLGQIDRAFEVPASGSALIAFRFEDQADGARISGSALISPSPNLDFTANSASDESGTDKTASVSTCIQDGAATRAAVVFSNSDSAAVWVASAAKVRGTKITDYGVIDAEKQDDGSIGDFGRQLWSYPYEMDNLADAQNIANYIVTSRKDPRGRVKRMTLRPRKNETLMTQALARTIGDRLAITETQTGAAADYFIIGEIHRLDMAGMDYTVTWILEPADANQYWILGSAGFSELGQTTTLGPL